MRSTSLSLVLLCAMVSALVAEDKRNPNNDIQFRGAKAEVYKRIGEDVLKIHIFEPKAESKLPRPAIVFFFGGGWKNGRPNQFEQHCRYLASRGMVAMTADYRVSSKHGTTAKECVEDGKSAVRWIRENARQLNIDPNRVAAGGGSAGGHVAASTAIISGFEAEGENLTVSSKPNALVLFNPAVTLAPFNGQQPLPEDRGEGLEERMGTKPFNLSPAHHVRSGLPPTIMFFGSEDFLLDGAMYFDKVMNEAGNRCELKLYDGYAHGFFNFSKFKNKPFTQTLQAADNFLNSLGYLQGSGDVKAWLEHLSVL